MGNFIETSDLSFEYRLEFSAATTTLSIGNSSCCGWGVKCDDGNTLKDTRSKEYVYYVKVKWNISFSFKLEFVYLSSHWKWCLLVPNFMNMNYFK